MKKLILSIAVLSLLFGQSSACDKCRNPRHVAWVAPTSTMTTSSVAYAPVMYSVPTTYSAPVSVAPMTFQSSSTQSLQYVPAQVSTVSSAPMYYTVPSTQSAFTTQSFVPQSYVAPSTVYYTADTQSAALSSAQTQGFLSDLIFRAGVGLAKPVACDMCKSLDCDNAGGNSSADPAKNLKDTIKEIGDLIKAVKGLEKEIKDAVGESTPAAEEAPGADNSEIAQLTRLRDDFRAMNQSKLAPRIAQEQK